MRVEVEMGELITGYFTKPLPETAHTNCFERNDLMVGYSEERAKADTEFIQSNRILLESVCARAEEMRLSIFVMRRMTDEGLRAIQARRRTLMRLSLHEICGMLMLSNRAQWVLMAPYYGGMVLEFIGRLRQSSTYADDRV